jgi:cyclopropane-fatty-acyl-phospholipid synthase
MMPDPAVPAIQKLFTALAVGFRETFAIRAWDGQTWRHGEGQVVFTIALRERGAARSMLWPFSRLTCGEAYLFGECDLEGDVLGFARLLQHFAQRERQLSLLEQLRLLWGVLKLPRRAARPDPTHAGRPTDGSRRADDDRAAISYTYDLPGELFRLFLDRNLQYSCGYFARPDESLDVAQERKMDLVCRKLRLRPGELFLDVGCGWGGLVAHAASKYGVEAVGVTLSAEQARWAQKRFADAGLGGRVRIALGDWRGLRELGTFDKVASVGMAEHVGLANLPAYFRTIHKCLRPGGTYLHHSITLPADRPLPVWTPFMLKYVFPNAQIPTLTQTLTPATAVAGFEVRDVESLREHYSLTLENWLRRVEACHDEVVRLVGEVRYRVFRLYLAVAAEAFRAGICNLHQCLLVKPDEGLSRLPLTRADWYA